MTEDQLKRILDEQLAHFLGQLTRHVDEKLDATQEQTNSRIDQVLTVFDGLAKRLDTDDQERTAVYHQLDRHERWHQQTASHLGLQLEP